MSKTIKQQIRVLVTEHERGLLPTADYRRLRRALLQRAARGETDAPPEPTATRPRMNVTGAHKVEDVLEALGETPPADVVRSDPTNRRDTPKPPSSPKKAAKPAPTPAPVRAEKSRNPLPLVFGGVVVAALALVALLLRPTSDDPASAQSEPPSAVEQPAPNDQARELAETYLDTNDWSPGRIRALTRDWDDLPPAAVRDIKSTGWYRELARELRDRLRLARSSATNDMSSATATALIDLARSLDVRVDDRSVAITPAPRDTRPTASRTSQTPPVTPAPDRVEPKPPARVVTPEPAPKTSALATTKSVAPETPAAAPVTQAVVPDPVSTAPTTPIETVLIAPAPVAVTGAPGQCEERAGKSRSRFCRDTLADQTPGPRLAIVRPGRFDMGSSSSAQEQPVRTVTMAEAYAISVSEVSFAQFDAFCAATGCTTPDNPWADASLPVVNVTWSEAVAYAQWWSTQTGQTYRLPTEAEWEFAARGGTTTDFPFGDEISPLNAHFSAGKKMDQPLPAEGRLIVANELGLKHVVGNVREWVQDVWHDSHANAPVDGSARNTGDTTFRVVRGGSFRDRASALRSAARDRQEAGSRDAQTGFRLVRTIAVP